MNALREHIGQQTDEQLERMADAWHDKPTSVTYPIVLAEQIARYWSRIHRNA